MKVLLVGSGAREHAIAAKLLRDDPLLDLIAAPGNPGLAEIAECIPVQSDDIRGLLGFAARARVDMTVVGPEGPLADGIADVFTGAGAPIFGPLRAAAEIETSKRFAKLLMAEAGVPTASATHHTVALDAHAAVHRLGSPVVIKASGLAAGKGVIVARSNEEAERAIDMMLRDRAFGDASAEILVEEFMDGEELSVFGITDGTHVIPMLPAQDHKLLLDGDAGPNTGGMGAYAPVSVATPQVIEEIVTRVFEPTLRALRGCGRPFHGLLYAGLMLTRDGPRVVEFNCRFGDPETQAILPLMRSSLLDLMYSVATGGSLAEYGNIVWEPMYSVATVLAAHGYPDTPRAGDSVRLPAVPPAVDVFHAGTRRIMESGELVTSGGRILTVTGIGPSITEAAACSRTHAGKVSFAGKQFRRDIAWRELERSARAS